MFTNSQLDAHLMNSSLGYHARCIIVPTIRWHIFADVEQHVVQYFACVDYWSCGNDVVVAVVRQHETVT